MIRFHDLLLPCGIIFRLPNPSPVSPEGGDAKALLKPNTYLETQHPITQKRNQQNALSHWERGKPTRRSVVTIRVRSALHPQPRFDYQSYKV